MPDRRLVLALLVAFPFAAGAASGAAVEPGEPAFSFLDPAIVESSGLALSDGLVVTVNDSGDSGRVFAVDPRTGETVGVTTWDTEPRDVEALAPAGDGDVWVGDIGDNLRRRDEVAVLRVPVARGERSVVPRSYRLRHPDGPRDAETLLSHPLTGRLYLVTKGVFSGEVLEAPLPLSAERPNRLREVGSTRGLVTDGAFLPFGGAVALRTYGQVLVYAFPSWELVTSWEPPEQQQAEGLAVDGDAVLLSTEGVRSTVLREPLPPEALAADLAHSALAPVWTATALVTGRTWLAPGPAMWAAATR